MTTQGKTTKTRMGITKQVYQHINGNQIYMDAAKSSRFMRRMLILDWFSNMGWITAEERMCMGVKESMRYYAEEKRVSVVSKGIR